MAPSNGAKRSLVARTVRDREVGGSNPLAPTNTLAARRPAIPVDGRHFVHGRTLQSAARAAAEIFVEGHVQGVGYRNYAQRRAALLGLVGWVMNMRDGRVRVRAEGPRVSLAELVRALGKG